MNFKYILNIFLNSLKKIINSSNEKTILQLFQSLRKNYADQTNNEILTEFKLFPKKPKRLYPYIVYKKNVSVILEGKLEDRNFIQETINWYKNCGIKNIILCTNNNSERFFNCKTISNFENKPEGIGTENNKLGYIKNALLQINDNDLVIKTRTDQRIYSEIFLTNIVSFHESYQINQESSSSKMGVISTNSSLSKINDISDHLYIDYGHKLKKMFNLNFREGSKILSEININLRKKYDNNQIPETLLSVLFTEFESGQWFINSYRRNLLAKDKCKKFILSKKDYISSLYKYLNFVRNSIYVIDPEDIDFFWLKPNFKKISFHRNLNKGSKSKIFFKELSSLNWLCLLNDRNYMEQIVNDAKKFSFKDSIS